jgi:hypothetical protein
VPFVLLCGSLPESVIWRLPQIVRAFARPASSNKISIKKDRFSAFKPKTVTGTPVVLGTTTLSRVARRSHSDESRWRENLGKISLFLLRST